MFAVPGTFLARFRFLAASRTRPNKFGLRTADDVFAHITYAPSAAWMGK